MRLTLTGCLLLLLLASSACDSFKQGVSEGFDKGYRQSCRDKVIKKGLSQQDADKYCECTLAKFKQTQSIDDAAKACIDELKLGPQSLNSPQSSVVHQTNRSNREALSLAEC